MRLLLLDFDGGDLGSLAVEDNFGLFEVASSVCDSGWRRLVSREMSDFRECDLGPQKRANTIPSSMRTSER